MRAFQLVCFSLIGLPLIVPILFITVFFLSNQTKTGVNVAQADVSSLPSQARNVTYFGIGRDICAEFDIAQDDFEEWCRSIGKPLTILGEGETGVVYRPLTDLEWHGKIPEFVNEHRPGTRAHDMAVSDRSRETLTSGELYYLEVWMNNGGHAIG